MKETSNTKLNFRLINKLAKSLKKTSSILGGTLRGTLHSSLRDIWRRKLGQRRKQKNAAMSPPLSIFWKRLVKRVALLPPQKQIALRELGDSQFTAGSYSNFSGSLKYHLFIPKNFRAGLPLLVMLHGCKQNAESFAIGTRMNVHAEELGFMVLYPTQSGLSNMNKCWNWYQSINQYRNIGEPAVIAGMTQQIINDYQIDPNRVFIAGLSAGAAMAYIVGRVYSDLYAAIGVHSGLLYRGINNVFSALAAMKTGSGQVTKMDEALDVASAMTVPFSHDARQTQPLIIFHGDQDAVVDPKNAADLIAYHHQDAKLITHEFEEHQADYDLTRTTYENEQGLHLAEQWIIHGAGHAWSGGDTGGNFTDAKGPDASLEMLRFFLKQP